MFDVFSTYALSKSQIPCCKQRIFSIQVLDKVVLISISILAFWNPDVLEPYLSECL